MSEVKIDAGKQLKVKIAAFLKNPRFYISLIIIAAVGTSALYNINKPARYEQNIYNKLLKTYTAETTISNADTEINSVIISQNFPDNYKIVKESAKGNAKNAQIRQWTVNVPANGKTVLSYTVEIPQDTRICN